MIENDHQLKITNLRLDEFKRELEQLEQIREDPSSVSTILIRAQIDALKSQISIFEKDISEYERNIEFKNSVKEDSNIWNLRHVIYNQLEVAGYYLETGILSDKSGSWINVYKEDPKKEKVAKTARLITISFDASGNMMSGINVYDEKFIMRDGETTKVF